MFEVNIKNPTTGGDTLSPRFWFLVFLYISLHNKSGLSVQDPCSTVQYSTLYSTVQYTVQYSTVHCTVQYSSLV